MSNAKYKKDQSPTFPQQLFVVLSAARSVWARRDLHLVGCAFAAAPDNASKEQAISQAFEDFVSALCGFDFASLEIFGALAVMPPEHDMSLGVTEGTSLRAWRAAFRAFRSAARGLLAQLAEHKPIVFSITRRPDGADPLAKEFRERCGELAVSLDQLDVFLAARAPSLLLEVAQ